MRYDLHLHTTFSDGTFSPEEVAEMAQKAGLNGISITDHDTVDAIPAARAACERAGLAFVIGVEISTELEKDEIHMLAYDFDLEDVALNQMLSSQREKRAVRGDRFVHALKTAGVHLPPENPNAETGDETAPEQGTQGRPHFARRIIAAGYASSVREAFEKYLRPGAPTFVPKDFPAASDVLEMINNAGGIGVLAHPGHHTSHSQILRLKDLGLKGIEACHPSHDDSLQAYYRMQANELGMIYTGGSDFHGSRPADVENLGKYYVTSNAAGNLFDIRTL